MKLRTLIQCLLVVIVVLKLVWQHYILFSSLSSQDTDGNSQYFNLSPVIKNNEKVLIVVPGFGDATRLLGLTASLVKLMSNPSISSSCLVFVWNPELYLQASSALPFCMVRLSVGLWTNHMLAVDVVPPEASTFSHVAVLIDDIDVTKVDLARFLEVMTESRFGMASASFPQWHYPVLHPRMQCSSHRSDFADILFSVFTLDAWKCWIGMIRASRRNQFGWGFDCVFADKCNLSIGVIDEFEALHAGKCENGGDCTRSYNESGAMMQLWEYIQEATAASNEEEARSYHSHVTSERPTKFRICESWKRGFLNTEARSVQVEIGR
jgi:hypothetical protein